MTGLVLRLGGPLQSWGEHSVFNDRDTLRYPTRSGLIGLLASAEGRGRDETLDRYAMLTLTVRVDRPGVLLRDFHTIGGGYARHRTVPTAEGKRRATGTATVVSNRYYLADAVFCVAVRGEPALITELAAALRNPRWQPFLGRRSCPPDLPVLLRESDTPEHDLHTAVPVARRARHNTDTTDVVDFITETTDNDPTAVTVLTDVPRTFHHRHRAYDTRTVTITPRPLPTRLFQQGNAYHKHLDAYRNGVNA